MTLYEAKQNINKKVLVPVDHTTKKPYLLTAIIARQGENDWKYTAEVSDVNKNSCSITALDKLEVANDEL